MPIQRLCYVSQIVDTDANRGAVIARNIAERSAVSNASVGVTGALVFIDGHFIQVLEGQQGPIEQTFERICHDFRHRELKLVDFQTVPERRFAEWGMASLVDKADLVPERRAALSEIHMLATLNAREAVVHMRRLLDDGQPAALAA